MPIRPSSASSSVVGVNLSLKILISQKRTDNFFPASLGRYPCTVQIWIWLNHPKCHFKMPERSNLAPFQLGDILFSIYARSFPMRVLMNCQKMGSIGFLKNGLIT